MTEEQLREKILALKRPDSVTAKYIIECELDDLMSLFTHQLELAKIEALRNAAQTIKAFDSYVIPGVNTGNTLVDKESVINLLTKESK